MQDFDLKANVYSCLLLLSCMFTYVNYTGMFNALHAIAVIVKLSKHIFTRKYLCSVDCEVMRVVVVVRMTKLLPSLQLHSTQPLVEAVVTPCGHDGGGGQGG
jgi:hypothetical protein